MAAASIRSLLIPDMEQSAWAGIWAFLPTVIGFRAGILFLLGLDHLIPEMSQGEHYNVGDIDLRHRLYSDDGTGLSRITRYGYAFYIWRLASPNYFEQTGGTDDVEVHNPSGRHDVRHVRESCE